MRRAYSRPWSYSVNKKIVGQDLEVVQPDEVLIEVQGDADDQTYRAVTVSGDYLPKRPR